MAIQIEPLVLSYPQFVLGEIINPDHANQNNYDITNKVNEFINDVELTRQMVEDAQEDATSAIDIANSKGDQAINTANSAVTTAETAEAKADSAVITANAADGKADTAIITANTALGQDITEPYSGALGAFRVANEANFNVSVAITAANEAIAAAEQAITDATNFAGNTEICYDVFSIVNANNGDGTFTYNNGTDDIIGDLTGEGYQQFVLTDTYYKNRNRIEATINDTLTRSQASGGLEEVGVDGELTNLVNITYPVDAGSEITFKYYRQISLGGKHGASHNIGASDEFIKMSASYPESTSAGQILFKVV